MSDWCILRTAGRSTLPLARSLDEAGFEVWTPVELVSRRRPRRRGVDSFSVPMTPTYVFARARHIFELIQLSANPGKNHDGFSVFRMREGVPLIADRALAELRGEEEKIQRRHHAEELARQGKRKGKSYSVGETVQVPASAAPSFAGMDGIVEESDARFTHIGFGGFLRLKISTFILRQNGVREPDSPLMGAAA